jgi:hypothetical protein
MEYRSPWCRTFAGQTDSWSVLMLRIDRPIANSHHETEGRRQPKRSAPRIPPRRRRPSIDIDIDINIITYLWYRYLLYHHDRSSVCHSSPENSSVLRVSPRDSSIPAKCCTNSNRALFPDAHAHQDDRCKLLLTGTVYDCRRRCCSSMYLSLYVVDSLLRPRSKDS